MKNGQNLVAVVFKRDVLYDPVKPLDILIEENGWEIETNDDILMAKRKLPPLGVLTLAYFPLTESGGVFADDVRHVFDYLIDLTKYTNALVFPSDHQFFNTASCMNSMLFSRRSELVKKIEDQYGHQDVVVREARAYLPVFDK